MAQTKKRKLTYKPSASLPKLPDIKEQWNLKKQYYKSDSDKQIELDIEYTIKRYNDFALKWRKQDFTGKSPILLLALTEYEALCADPRLSKVARYFSLRSELNATDSKADKALALLQKRIRPASNNLMFFTLELGKIPSNKQKEFLNDPSLIHFKYFLKRIFENAKHDLTEAEEKIISLKAQPLSLWSQMTDKLISTSEVVWQSKPLPLPEAFETIETLPSGKKPKLWDIIISKVDSFGISSEFEFNAIITDVRNEDALRKYSKPYSATALAYEHNEKSIEELVEVMSSEGFVLSRKFYTLKAKYHGVKTIPYACKYDAIDVEPTIDFSEALLVCRDVFYQVNPLYGEIFDKMLKDGQIDVFPKKGKRGGAFMSNQTGHPVNVLLNHTSTMKALETLAHEMGHAVHASRSATNSALYDGHSIVTAETASTLFENLVFNAIYAQAPEAVKLVLLHDKLTRDIATMQRQIAFFNCELEIHNTIHDKGAMTHEELKRCMYKHLVSYLGKSVKIELLDGASYVYVPHLRYGFYVYSYTFGHLMSSIIARNYQADNSYRKEIDIFLTSGSMDTVDNIFKKIGIDTTDHKTFSLSLQSHAKDIAQFEALVKKRKG